MHKKVRMQFINLILKLHTCINQQKKNYPCWGIMIILHYQHKEAIACANHSLIYQNYLVHISYATYGRPLFSCPSLAFTSKFCQDTTFAKCAAATRTNLHLIKSVFYSYNIMIKKLFFVFKRTNFSSWI